MVNNNLDVNASWATWIQLLDAQKSDLDKISLIWKLIKKTKVSIDDIEKKLREHHSLTYFRSGNKNALPYLTILPHGEEKPFRLLIQSSYFPLETCPQNLQDTGIEINFEAVFGGYVVLTKEILSDILDITIYTETQDILSKIYFIKNRHQISLRQIEATLRMAKSNIRLIATEDKTSFILSIQFEESHWKDLLRNREYVQNFANLAKTNLPELQPACNVQ